VKFYSATDTWEEGYSDYSDGDDDGDGEAADELDEDIAEEIDSDLSLDALALQSQSIPVGPLPIWTPWQLSSPTSADNSQPQQPAEGTSTPEAEDK
jgi:hypothetical protein